MNELTKDMHDLCCEVCALQSILADAELNELKDIKLNVNGRKVYVDLGKNLNDKEEDSETYCYYPKFRFEDSVDDYISVVLSVDKTYNTIIEIMVDSADVCENGHIKRINLDDYDTALIPEEYYNSPISLSEFNIDSEEGLLYVRLYYDTDCSYGECYFNVYDEENNLLADVRQDCHNFNELLNKIYEEIDDK